MSVLLGKMEHMSEEVRDLGQQLVAAAWEVVRITSDAEAQTVRLGDLLDSVEEAQAQLDGLRMRLVCEAQLAGADAVLDKVRSSTRATTQRASADLRLAQDLGEGYPLIHQAVCQGTISLAQAEGMVIGLKKLPVRLTRHDLERCQTTLLAEAEFLGPQELRILAARMLELIDPDAADQADAARLAREERLAKAGRSLRIKPDHHGSMRITGQLPVADGALLQAQIDALLPPVSTYANEDFTPSRDARQADALVLLTQVAANAGSLPAHGLGRPQIHVTLQWESLRDGLGRVGLLDRGDDEQLTPAEARRLACDARLIPIVLGGHSQPLDVGREHRVVPKWLRAALTQRDQGCVFPHCAAPAAACEAHHIQPWWAGGETSLANTMLLCPHHHRLVEPVPNQSAESQWQAHIDPATGLPVFLPPPHIDAARRPRQHRRFRLAMLQLIPDQAEPPSFEVREPHAAPVLVMSSSPAPPPRRATLPPPLNPKDDPWHPHYEPPPRR